MLDCNLNQYHDPFFGLNAVELLLGAIVILVAVHVVAKLWRTFK